MTWLNREEAENLLRVSVPTIKRYVKQGRYSTEYVSGKGRGGKQLRIALESLPQEAQDLYNGVQHEKEDITKFTQKQRDAANFKAMVVDMYQKSELSAQEFVNQFNEENTAEPIKKSTLLRWQRKYKNKSVTNFIDKRGGCNKGKYTIASEVWDYFYCAYMTEQERSIQLCYDITARKFDDIPSVSAFYRKAKDIPEYALVKYRKGETALRDLLPSMERSRDDISSNDIWCSDHHLIDMFVKSKDGKKAVRLWLTVFHDMKSNKIVSHIVRNADPNSTVVKKCFRLGVEQFGVPKEVYFDNGKDYRSKSFCTDYPLSLINQLGFNVLYATPYHGQAKPTERFFLTFEQRFSKLFPTYAGRNAKVRPECMQTSEKEILKIAPDFEEYLSLLDDYIKEYNNTSHSGIGMYGKCPDQMYIENLKIKRNVSDIEVLKVLCGNTAQRIVHKNGVSLINNTYRSEYLIPYFKQPVNIVYDPENIDKINVMDKDGNAICTAFATVRTMFRSTTEEDYKRAEKERKAVRVFNEKHKPARQLSQNELIAKYQFEELQYPKNKDTIVEEQINPKISANSKRFKETERPKKIKKEDSIASILNKKYTNERKAIGG